jgi:hypothetical protein
VVVLGGLLFVVLCAGELGPFVIFVFGLSLRPRPMLRIIFLAYAGKPLFHVLTPEFHVLLARIETIQPYTNQLGK